MSRTGSRTILLILLLLTSSLAGCTIPGTSSGGNVEAASLVTHRTTVPGGTVAFPLSLDAQDGTDTTATVVATETDGFTVEPAPGDVEVPANGTGAYVHVTVPEDADAGEYTLTVPVEDAEGARSGVELTVVVEEPGSVVEEGETAQVHFTFRFGNGTILQTNVAAVANSSLPKAQTYRAPQGPRGTQPAPIPTAPNPQVPSFLQEEIVGLGVNHSTTFTVPSSQSFGNDTLRETREATTEVERNRTVPRTMEGPLRIYERFLPNGTEEGDNVSLSFSPVDLPYDVTHLNDTHVELTMNVTVGDHTTLQQLPAWPDAAEAVAVTSTEVTFRLTPTTDDGEAFTYRPGWENATHVAEVNSTHIILEHAPEEGSTITERTRQGSTTWTVESVGPDEIVLTRENPNPYAGEELVVDITVVGTQPPRSTGAPGS